MFTGQFISVESPLNQNTHLYFQVVFIECDRSSLVKFYGTHGGVDLGCVFSVPVRGTLSDEEAARIANECLAEAAGWAENQRLDMIEWLSA